MNRAELVEKIHPKLSIRQQCELLSVSRSTLNYTPVEESREDRRLMRVMDEIYMENPCMGSRRLATVLERDHGIKANRKRIQRLRRKMGIETIWCRPRRTSQPDHGLWRSLKYEDIYLKGYTTIGELEAGIQRWMDRYNTWRPHQTLNNQTPAKVYETDRMPATPAAEMRKAA